MIDALCAEELLFVFKALVQKCCAVAVCEPGLVTLGDGAKRHCVIKPIGLTKIPCLPQFSEPSAMGDAHPSARKACFPSLIFLVSAPLVNVVQM